jgi:SAM-dependent methyltransferase
MNVRRLIRGVRRRATLPQVRGWVRSKVTGAAYTPPVGMLWFGHLRRLSPLSRQWGEDRGGPLDRHYIEQFLTAHRADVRGRVLEIGDDDETRTYGGDRVTRSDVMNLEPGHPKTTIVGDLAAADHVPSDAFDCVLLMQTLQLIYDVRSAVRHVYRILKPGGVVLATAPGISQINRHDSDTWGECWCWNFTALSLRRLFAECFPPDAVEVRPYGNVLAAAGFLYGLGRGDVRPAELDHHDPDYELLISVRARKPDAPEAGSG